MNSNAPADDGPFSVEAIQQLLQRNDASEMRKAAMRLRKWLGNIRELVHELDEVIVDLEGSTSNQGNGYAAKESNHKEVS